MSLPHLHNARKSECRGDSDAISTEPYSDAPNISKPRTAPDGIFPHGPLVPVLDRKPDTTATVVMPVNPHVTIVR